MNPRKVIGLILGIISIIGIVGDVAITKGLLSNPMVIPKPDLAPLAITLCITLAISLFLFFWEHFKKL